MYVKKVKRRMIKEKYCVLDTFLNFKTFLVGIILFKMESSTPSFSILENGYKGKGFGKYTGIKFSLLLY